MQIRRFAWLLAFVAVLLANWALCAPKPLSVANKPTTFTVDKTALDANHYRGIRLANGLVVLLVQVPEDTQAALAMSVAVGSQFDPMDYQGLSHLLEHTVFLGSKSYPQKDDFALFVQQNGGHYNAYTSKREVNYFFSIDERMLPEAMVRFAALLSEPLFVREDVVGEREVVESEYRMNLYAANRQLADVLREITPQAHPFHALAVGTRETLDDQPKPIEQALSEFFVRYYHAGNMRLVISAPYQLDRLEALTRRAFAVIHTADKRADATTLPIYQQLRNKNQLPRLVRWQPSDGQRSLSINFFTPRFTHLRAQRPWYYIAELLGHEGEGSLAQLLEEKGYINSLQSGSSIVSDTQQLFGVRIDLTKSGLANWRQIVGLTLAYVNLIRTQPIDTNLRNEQRILQTLALHTSEPADLLTMTRHLASQLQEYTPQEVLIQPYVLDTAKDTAIKSALSHITFTNMEVLLSGLQDTANAQKTKWFSVPYKQQKITSQQLDKWRALGAAEVAQLHLPKKNPFIPRGVDVDSLTLSQASTALLPNEAFVSNEATPIVHILSGEQDRLRGIVRVFIEARKRPLSAREQITVKMLLALLRRQINPRIYPALLAGANIQTHGNTYGAVVSVSGYRQKQAELLRVWYQGLRTLRINADTLAAVRTDMQDTLSASLYASPFRSLNQWLTGLVAPTGITPQQERTLVRGITNKEVQDMHRLLLEQSVTRVMAYGNYSKRFLAHLASVIPNLVGPPTHSRILSLKRTKAKRTVYSFTSPQKETHAVLWYALGQSRTLTERAVMLVLARMLQQPFFTQLRTEQQLGYVVSASYSSIEDTPAIAFVVQSSRVSTYEMSKAIEQFLADITLTQKMLTQQVESLLVLLKINPDDMASQLAFYQRELWRANQAFDTRKRFTTAVKQVSLIDVQQMLQKLRSGPVLLIRTDDGADFVDGFVAHTLL